MPIGRVEVNDMAKAELVRVSMDVPKSVRQAFKARCVMKDISMGERMSQLMREDIQKRNPSG